MKLKKFEPVLGSQTTEYNKSKDTNTLNRVDFLVVYGASGTAINATADIQIAGKSKFPSIPLSEYLPISVSEEGAKTLSGYFIISVFFGNYGFYGPQSVNVKLTPTVAGKLITNGVADSFILPIIARDIDAYKHEPRIKYVRRTKDADKVQRVIKAWGIKAGMLISAETCEVEYRGESISNDVAVLSVAQNIDAIGLDIDGALACIYNEAGQVNNINYTYSGTGYVSIFRTIDNNSPALLKAQAELVDANNGR